MNKFIWPLRIYYEDTDAGGVVYYANYLKFMERARTEWLRHLNIEQPQLRQQHHLIFVVRHVTIDYLKAAIFDDLLQIITTVTRLGKASLTMTQTIVRQDDLLCAATIKIACVNLPDFRPQPFPKDIFEKFKTIITTTIWPNYLFTN